MPNVTISLNDSLTAARSHPADLAPLIGTVKETQQPMLPARVHRDWLDLFLRHEKVLLLAPRYHAKSEYASGIFPAWVIGNIPTVRILYLTGDEPLATDATRRMHKYLTDPVYRAVFPILPPLVEATQRSLVLQGADANPTWFATSIMAVKAGRRSDLIICDDVVTYSNSRTPELRDELYDRFISIVLPMLAEGGKLVMVGTPWYKGDLYDTLKDMPGITFRRDSAIQDDGTLLWPEFRTPEWIEQQRQSMPERHFTQQLLCRISEASGEVFSRDWFDIVDEHPPLVEAWLVIDTATSERATSDPRAFLTVGKDVKGTIYILHAAQGRWNPTDLQEQCVKRSQACQASYGRVFRGMLAEDIKENLVLQSWLAKDRIPLTLIKHNNLSKSDRADFIVPRCAQGHVKLVKGSWNAMVLDQVVAFTRTDAHRADDLTDNLVYGSAKLWNLTFTMHKSHATVTVPLRPRR